LGRRVPSRIRSPTWRRRRARHCGQSGFANTDLDAQLTQRGIEKIIVVGFVANTCIESTARFGMGLGYHVILVKEATAAFDEEGMHAAHEVNGPRFSHAILTTEELLALLSPSARQAESQSAQRRGA
jgi:nicotinamidase-related amidase